MNIIFLKVFVSVYLLIKIANAQTKSTTSPSESCLDCMCDSCECLSRCFCTGCYCSPCNSSTTVPTSISSTTCT